METKMQSGKIVDVWEYPDAPTTTIGKGILIECTFKNHAVQMWLVKELKTGKIAQRVFYNHLVDNKPKGGEA